MTDQPNDPQTPETPEPDAAVPPSKDERNMAMIAHLLGIVLCIIGPLII